MSRSSCSTSVAHNPTIQRGSNLAFEEEDVRDQNSNQNSKSDCSAVCTGNEPVSDKGDALATSGKEKSRAVSWKNTVSCHWNSSASGSRCARPSKTAVPVETHKSQRPLGKKTMMLVKRSATQGVSDAEPDACFFSLHKLSTALDDNFIAILEWLGIRCTVKVLHLALTLFHPTRKLQCCV